MSPRRVPVGAVLGTVAVTLAASGLSLVTAGPAAAATGGLVVGQVYGGGGNSGASYAQDYVELTNTTASAISVASDAVQYASATGTSWQVTALTGSVPAHGHYLVAEASGGGSAPALLTPDATGTINLSATSGKVALTSSATPLTCGSAAGSCSAVASVLDLVGYGSASDYEGSAPASAGSNTLAVSRDAAGDDTDDNRADFTAATPAPQASGSGSGTGTGPVAGLQIHDVQGAAQLSPYVGRQVTGVPGVVTALTGSGFYYQDPTPDSDPSTSEAVYVFTRSAPTVTVGDAVTVDATVAEFNPGGSTSRGLTTTELDTPTVTVVSAGNALPAATVVGYRSGDRMPPTSAIDVTSGTDDVDSAGHHFDPATNGIDFYESLEGMRVEEDDAVAVGPTNSFGETAVIPDGGEGSTGRTTRGGISVTSTDMNPEILTLAAPPASSAASVTVPTLNVRDSLPGATVGVLNYDFGQFQLDLTQVPAVVSGHLGRQSFTSPRGKDLTMATFNVENLAATDPKAKFAGLAKVVVHNLADPDVLAVEEIQDDDGATDDGVTDAAQTWNLLIQAIHRAGGPTYSYRQIDPTNDADGGEPGGNIRQGFLFRTDDGLAFVDRPGGTATSATTVVGKGAKTTISASPGRISPDDPAWDASRKPLVGEFTFHGTPLFLVANHWVAKLGDDPTYGRYQPPVQSSEAQRTQQAQLVNDFVTSLQKADPAADVAVLGDLNDEEFSTSVATLTDGTGLVDLPATLPRDMRYTYVYQGNSEVLDHILLSRSLDQTRDAYQVVHVNSEFTDQVSDHEPQEVALRVR